MAEKQQEEPMNIRSKEKDRLREIFYRRYGYIVPQVKINKWALSLFSIREIYSESVFSEEKLIQLFLLLGI